MEIEKFDRYLNKWVDELSLINGSDVSREEVFNALFILTSDDFGFEHPVSLWNLEISYQNGLEILRDFDFEVFEKQFSVEIEFDRDELFLEKARIKSKGFIMTIYKFDKDPFPSNPHGHILDQNIKIDLSTGDCYRNRTFIRRIKRKELLTIREKAKQIFKGDLPQLKI